MATGRERAPIERETLVFPESGAAEQFQERVAERLSEEAQPGVSRKREIVGEELQQEFEAAGESVDVIRHPWEHTEDEHAEVQRLVDAAFEQDLGVALKKAKASGHYPRNIDLLHDVLTTEMYDLMRETELNRQPLAGWILGGLVMFLVIALIIVLLFAL